MSDWHRKDIADVFRALRTDPETGLSGPEAAARLHGAGPNGLPGGPTPSPLRILLSQFASTMVVVLPEAKCPVAIAGQDRLPG